MPSDEWRKQLNLDFAVPADAMSEQQTFRSEVNQNSSIRSKSSNRSNPHLCSSPASRGRTKEGA